MNKIDLQQELTKLVQFKPVTNLPKNCATLLDYEENILRQNGLKVIRGEHGAHPYLLASNGDMNNVDILLQAHIDVVPATDQMFSVDKIEDKLIGRGTYDMLFAVACFNKLVAEQDLSALTVGVMFISDEEIGGFNGVGELIKGYSAKVCILPDAGTHTHICNEAKGVLQLSLTISGVAGHGARPWLTDSPIPKIGAVVDEIKKLFPNTDPEATTCSFTQIHGGEANNQVPSSAELILDIRFQPSDDPAQLKQQVEDAMKPLLVAVDITDVVGDSYAVDLAESNVALFMRIHQQITGTRLTAMRAPGSSDARFITPLGIPVIMTRPDGGGLHGDDEWVSISSLTQYYEILKTYVLSYRKV